VITARLATHGDIDALIASRDLFDEVPSRFGLGAFLGSEWDWLIVGLVGEEIAGFCTVHALPRPDHESRHGFMYEIGTCEPFQRQGVARSMIEFARSECERRGVEGLWVITNRSNEPACRLYEACEGFSAADDEVVYEWP
jgi:ribosomal protein S18 acetylase RimI-like enzyme